MNKIIAVLTVAILMGVSQAVLSSGEDYDLSAAIHETVTEEVKKNAEGKLRETITTTERIIKDHEKVVETKKADRDGNLKTVVRNVERWDAVGNYMKAIEKLRDGSMVTTYVYSETRDAEGGLVITEKARNREGLLIITKRTTTGRAKDFSFRMVEQRNAKGELVTTFRSETVTTKDGEGNQVRITSQRDADGEMIPVQKITFVNSIGGAKMTITEVKDKNDNWVAINEKSTIRTHVTGN